MLSNTLAGNSDGPVVLASGSFDETSMRREELVRHLIKRSLLESQVPMSRWPSFEPQLLQLAHQILCSSLNGPSGNDHNNASKLSDAIKKIAARDGDIEKAIKVTDLLHSFLVNSNGIKEKGAILNFMLRLAERPRINCSPRLGTRLGIKDGHLNTNVFNQEPTEISMEMPKTKAEAWRQFQEFKAESSTSFYLYISFII